MLEILFEDDDLIIVNKPSGIPVHQTLDPKRQNLENLVKIYLEKKIPNPYLALHHRLDLATSGAILFVKNSELNSLVSEIFKTRKIKKTYLALVSGKVEIEPEFLMKDFVKIKKINKLDRLEKVDKGGDVAMTIIKNTIFIESKNITRLELELITGKMHQIRAQLSYRNMPILGDEWYGGAVHPRLALHSYKLEFIHPKTQENIHILAPSSDFYL